MDVKILILEMKYFLGVKTNFGLEFETTKFLVVDSSSESLGFARRIFVIAVGQMGSSRLVMNLGSSGGHFLRFAHQGCQTEISFNNFSLDKFLQ